jgi:hypothetical protein
MTLLPGANTMAVKSSTHPVLISGEESPIHLHTTIGTFFFWVPAGTRTFGVRVSGVGVGEAVRAALVDPVGEVVEEIDNAATHQFDVNLSAPSQGEAWGIQLQKPTQILMDDQYIDLRGIPPLLAGDKGALLKPDGAPAYAPVERTEAGPQGEFLLNGKPFLPLVITMLENDAQGTFDERLQRAASAGFNGVQVGGSAEDLRRKLDRLRHHGLYGRVALFNGYIQALRKVDANVSDLVKSLRDHPALLGWELQDELNDNPEKYPPEQVREAYQALRRLDPNHAVWLNLTQFGPDGAASWKKWADCADVMGNDNYPFSRGGEVAAYAAALKWVAGSNPGVAATYLQLSPFNPEFGPPTAANLRMLAYLSLLHGHRALSYFGYAFDGVETWRDYPLLWKGAADLNAELTRALPMLLAPACEISLTTSLDGEWKGLSWDGETIEPLRCVLRQIDENRIALFAQGFPVYEATARFALDPTVPVRKITVWPTGEAVKMKDNRWIDTFFRGQVRVYVVQL